MIPGMTAPSLVARCHPKHHRIKRQFAHFHKTKPHFAKVQSLSKDIEDALRTILVEVVLPGEGETAAKRFQTIRDQFEASVREGSFHGIYHESGAIAICLVPDVAARLDHAELQKLSLPLLSTIAGQQVFRGTSVLSVEMDGLGDASRQEPVGVAQISVDGTILAADVVSLSPCYQDQQINNGRTIPIQELESQIVNTVMSYARILHNLAVPLPWRLAVSLLNVGGYRMLPPTRSRAHRRLLTGRGDIRGMVPAGSDNVVAPEIRISGFEGVASEESVSQVLKDTFDFLSRECGFPGSFKYGGA